MITFRSGDWVLYAIGACLAGILVYAAVDWLAQRAALAELPRFPNAEARP